jgi:hypothetical protein
MHRVGWVRSLSDMNWLYCRQFVTCWPGCLQHGIEPTLHPAYEGYKHHPGPFCGQPYFGCHPSWYDYFPVCLQVLTPSSGLRVKAAPRSCSADDMPHFTQISIASSNLRSAPRAVNMSGWPLRLTRDFSNGGESVTVLDFEHRRAA